MTQDADKHRDDDALAAEYVTGVLPHGERAAFAARLEAEPALREKVRFWDEQLAPLADGIEPADAFVRSGLAKSKGEVRKNAGGFRLNGVAVDLDEAFGAADLLVGRAAVLSHGKRRHALLVRAENP